MTPRRSVFNWARKGWTGWALLALAAIPVLVLTFFFFAVMLALFAVVVAVSVARLAWYRGWGVSPGPDPRAHSELNTFTINVRDVTDQAPAAADENRPAPTQIPPSSSRD